jgi:hypothetical protein
MTAARSDIDRWIEQGQEEGARWVIVAVDSFDHDNYPIFVKADEDFWDRWPDATNMQGVDEVYDLQHPTVSVEDQVEERRARYEPPREEVSS